MREPLARTDGVGDPTGSDLLVMGDDRRPYLVHRFVIARSDGAWLCWVSVSAAAGWSWWPSPGGHLTVVTLPAPPPRGRAVPRADPSVRRQ